MAQTIDYKALKKKQKDKKATNVMYVDVRPSDVYAQEHADKFQNITPKEFTKHMKDFEGKEVILMCEKGEDAPKAAEAIEKKGKATSVSTFEGGYSTWKEENEKTFMNKIKNGFKDSMTRIKEAPLSGKIVLFVGLIFVFMAFLINLDHDMTTFVCTTILGIIGIVMIIMIAAGKSLKEVDKEEEEEKKEEETKESDTKKKKKK